MEGEFFVSIFMEFNFVGMEFLMSEIFESKYSTNLFAVDAGEPQVLGSWGSDFKPSNLLAVANFVRESKLRFTFYSMYCDFSL